MFVIFKKNYLKLIQRELARSSTVASVTSRSGISRYFMMDVLEELPGLHCLILKVKSVYLRWALFLAWHGSASAVRLNSGAWHGRVCPTAEGTQAHGKPLIPSQLYFAQLSQLLRHILLISPLFFIIWLTDWRSLDLEGRRQSCPWMDHQGSGSSGRTADTKWMTPVDGPCLQVRTAFKVSL